MLHESLADTTCLLLTALLLLMQVWLQEFAWTEADKPVKVAARAAMVPHHRQLASEPILCFETMMNLLYWSCFVYDHSRVSAPHDLSSTFRLFVNAPLVSYVLVHQNELCICWLVVVKVSETA